MEKTSNLVGVAPHIKFYDNEVNEIFVYLKGLAYKDALPLISLFESKINQREQEKLKEENDREESRQKWLSKLVFKAEQYDKITNLEKQEEEKEVLVSEHLKPVS